MKAIVNIDCNDHSSNSVYNSAFKVNELHLYIRALDTQKNNLRLEIITAESETFTINVTIDNGLIYYLIPKAFYSIKGTMKVRVLANEGNSDYFEFETTENLTGNEDLYCRKNSLKFEIIDCSKELEKKLCMISGTHVVNFANSNGTLLHTWEEIQNMFYEAFNFKPDDRTLLGITVVNGDTATTQEHVEGACWYPGDSSRGSGDVHVLIQNNFNGAMRINFAYFYYN